MRLMTWFFSLSFLSCSAMPQAEMVTPVFSGAWYVDESIHYIDEDACGASIFSYGEGFSGEARGAAASFLQAPARLDCSWEPVQFVEDLPFPPRDYPGGSVGWSSIISDSQNPQMQRWLRECKNNQGSTVDKEEVVLSPAYICPVGSRFSYDATMGVNGCSTRPDTCTADVVGRALKYPGVSWVGHVGITAMGWEVVEVLNDPVVIHAGDSFDDFRTQPSTYPYWGDAYELLGTPTLTENQAISILTSGLNQADYDPKYTLFSTWQVGSGVADETFDPEAQKFEKVQSFQRAIFRCDTFVDYSYQAGAGLNIITPGGFYLPMNTYESFKEQRFVSTNPNSNLKKTSVNLKDTSPAPSAPPMNALTPVPKTLELIFGQSDLDVASADQFIKQFQDNSLMSRKEKLNQLWTWALKYQLEPIKFGYLLDVIGFMHPIELESLFIQAYQSASSRDEKLSLISAIWQGALISSGKSISVEDQEAIKQVQIFLKTELNVEKDPEILRQLIYGYSAITPGKEADKLITEKLKFIGNSTFQGGENTHYQKATLIMPEKEAFMIKIRHAWMTSESQAEIFPNLFSQNRNNPIFSEALCKVYSTYPSGQLIPLVKESTQKILMEMNLPKFSKNAHGLSRLNSCEISPSKTIKSFEVKRGSV